MPMVRIAEAAPVPSNQRPPLMIASNVMSAWNRFQLTRVNGHISRGGGEPLRDHVERLVEQRVADGEWGKEAEDVAPGAAGEGDHAVLVAVRRHRRGPDRVGL